MALTLRHRFSHYLRLSRIIGKLLQLRLDHREENRSLARQAIAANLGKAGGIIMKIGQVIADTGQDTDFEPLLTGIPPRKLAEMLTVLEKSPKHPNIDDFQAIEKHASAASLGQVHRAILRSGETVAVKLQYPHIRDTVDSELALAGLLPALGPVKKWGMDLNGYRRTLTDNMHAELDYRTEAQRQLRFYNGLDVPGLRVPRIHESLCSERVLVQEWKEGEFFSAVLAWPVPERMLIGRTLLLTLFQSLFRLGEVHGDPHMGNTLYRHGSDGKPEVVLLDYGCTITIGMQQRMALLKLIIGLRAESDENPITCFAAMGFNAEKLSHIVAELPALARILCKPFLDDQPFDTTAWAVKEGFNLLLEDRRWWFRSAGPSDLFLLLRAFQGVVRQLEQLEVRLPWWPLLVKAVGEEVIRDAQEYELPTVAKEYLMPKEGIKPIASRLKVEVRRDGELIVESTLPPDAALRLDEVMPEQVLDEITRNGTVDLKALHERLVNTRLAPQELFTMQEANKSYRVWLE